MKASVIERGSALNKTLSVLMALVLAVSLAPLPAYAETPGEPAPEQEQQLDPAPETSGEPVAEKQSEPNADSPAKPETTPVEPEADSPVELVGASSSSPAERVNVTVPEPAATSSANPATRTFTDAATSIKLEVTANDAATAAALESAVLQVKTADQITNAEAAKAAFGAQAGEYAAIELYEVKLVSNGSDLALAAADTATITLPAVAQSTIWGYREGQVVKLESTQTDGKITAKAQELGVVAVVTTGENGEVEAPLLLAANANDESETKTLNLTWEDYAADYSWVDSVYVAVKGPEGELPAKDSASLRVTRADASAVRDALSAKYDGVGDSTVKAVYEMSVVDAQGAEVALPETAAIEYVRFLGMVASDEAVSAPTAFAFDGSALTELARTDVVEGAAYGYANWQFDTAPSSLGAFALVDMSGLTEKKPVETKTLNLTWEDYASDYSWVDSVYVAVRGPEDELPAQGSASLRVTRSDASNVRAALVAKYDGVNDSTVRAVYDISVVDAQGSEIDLPESAKLEYVRFLGMVMADEAISSPSAFAFDGLALTELTRTDVVEGAAYGYANWQFDTAPSSLGTFALVDMSGLTEKKAVEGLAPEVYTADVNIYVPASQAPIGQKVYVTDDGFPPITYRTQNGQIEVKEDGTAVVTAYVRQPVFWVEKISSGDKVKVLNTEFSGDLGKNYDGYTTRIVKVTAEVSEPEFTGNREYQFGDCIQYATPFNFAANWDMWLQVDYDSAVIGAYEPPVDAAWSYTYNDLASGASLTVSTDDEALGAKLASFSFTGRKVVDDSSLSSIKGAFETGYSHVPDYVAYDFTLVDASGDPVNLGDAAVSIMLPGAAILNDGNQELLKVYRYGDGELESLNRVVQDGSIIIPTASLGVVVATDGWEAPWTSKVYVVGEPEVTATFRTASQWDASLMNYIEFNARKETVGGKSVYDFEYVVNADYLSEADSFYKSLRQGYIDQGKSTDEASSLAMADWIGLGGNLYGFTYGLQSEFLITVPVDNADDRVVLVYNNGTSPVAYELPSTYDNGKVTVKIDGDTPVFASTEHVATEYYVNDLGYKQPYFITPATGLAFAYLNGAASATAERPTVYLQVISVEERTVAEPQTLSTPTYNGDRQSGVSIDENCKVVSGDASAVDSGSYSVTVAPKDGYTWLDGTKGEKTVSWRIAKAKLIATYTSEEIKAGETPNLVVSVEGFVNGETAETAAGYVAPTVALPDELEAGKSYELKPANGQAKNYTFTYVPGTLSVKAASAPTTEERLKPGTYTVTANVWLNAADADSAGFPVLKGIVGADGGAYMTNATNPNGAEGGATGVPTSPVSDNATLVVADDGALTLTVPIANPVFTMQKLGTNASLGGMSYTTKAGSYGNYQSRIDSITVTLPSAEDATYVLAGSAFHPTILASQYPTAITAPLRLTVGGLGDLPAQDTASASLGTDALSRAILAAEAALRAVTVSADGSDVVPAVKWNTQGNVDKLAAQVALAKAALSAATTQGVIDSALADLQAATDTFNSSSKAGTKAATSGTTDGNGATTDNNATAGSSGGTATAAGTVQTTSDGRLAAGTYTVSANIWVNKETSGLPLQPHFTSAAFPPMNPVAGNATLRVGGNGRAYLTVPIVIQSRVMQVRSISGLPIVDYSSSDGGLTSITLDLGALSATDTVVMRSCTASVHLGDLAASIIGGERDRTWAATFQMNFTGLPSSGGGEVPAAVQAMIDAAGADGRAVDAEAAAESAKASALGALTKNLRPQRAYADDDSADPSAPAQQGSFPWAPVAGGVAVAAIAGVAGYLLGSRRKRDMRRAG